MAQSSSARPTHQSGHAAQPTVVTENRLGIGLQDVTAAIASAFRLGATRGAIVASLERGPAYEAGVQVGDIFLAVDGQPVTGAAGMLHLLALTGNGRIVETEVWRAPYPMPLKIALPRAGETPADAPKKQEAMPRSTPLMGLIVRELSNEDRCRFGVEGGLLVLSSENPSAEAGIRRDDVVLMLNSTPLMRITDFYAAAKGQEGREVALLVLRNGWRGFHVVTLPEAGR